ncbi:hypothetical protein IPV08_10710 [Methylobacterium sp. SD274]|uniref:hypothetical protein n=1 Tax=Methylobacterium sp. SD274 TaxID=2782009 RepID=UPI001A96D54B|nr:hypothetical protein [Methylobacterium sp. SD274]MBO1020439.1 hypothetical protein [Methylobacterium sp. SD274]
MRTNKIVNAFGLVVILGISGAAHAQTIDKTSDGTVTWQAGVDGATIDFNPDGTWKRVYSKYAHPVAIADKRGVKTATIIAEEKAKANIVRFLNQHVTSGRVVAEVENTMSKTDQQKGSGGESITTTDQRAMSQSLTEMTGSFASGTLTGVVVLENGYDDKEKEAWVVVGVSRKSMAAAKATQGAINESLEPARSMNTNAPSAAPQQPERAGSFTRRSNSDF